MKSNKYYLMCERNWVYHILIAIGGFFGAYTFIVRGNVFCNAQTGNVVLMGIAFGSGEWGKGFYYFIPISAYLLGAFVSELVPNTVKHCFLIRWETLLIGIEIGVVIILGMIPDSMPVQISQVIINFIASMQYNTFRQAEGFPMATTFATNHIRQIGVGLAKEVKQLLHGEERHREKLVRHSQMFLYFVAGSVIGTIFCNRMHGRAIWMNLIPLTIIFVIFLRADLKLERDMADINPSGH